MRYSKIDRQNILKNIIDDTIVNDFSLQEICRRHSITTDCFKEWLSMEDNFELKEKYQEAKKLKAPGNKELLGAAKKGLIKLLEGCEETTVDEVFDLTSPNGEKKPIKRTVKTKKIAPNANSIQLIIDRLSQNELSIRQDTANLLNVFTRMNEVMISSGKYNDAFMHQMMQLQKEYFNSSISITPQILLSDDTTDDQTPTE